MRKLVIFILLVLAPNNLFAQNYSKNFSERKLAEHMIIVAGWFSNESCFVFSGEQKNQFRKNLEAANQIMAANLKDKSVKQINSEIAQRVKKNRCDAASVELINKSFQIAENFNKQNSGNASYGQYLSRPAAEIFNLTLAIKIQDKCRFLEKDQSSIMILSYMSAAQAIDKDYGSGSSTSILTKFAAADASSRNISCGQSEKNFTQKVLQALIKK